MQKDLNETIQKTIDFAFKEAERSKILNMLNASDFVKTRNDIVRNGYEKAKNTDWKMSYKDFTTKAMFKNQRLKNNQSLLEKYVIRPSGFVKFLVGTIASFSLGALIMLVSLVFGLVGISSGINLIISITIASILFLVGIYFSKKMAYISRFDKYISKLNMSGFTEIKELRRKSNIDMKVMMKDLKKMINDGNLIEGHLVEDDTILITDNNTYEQYLHAQTLKYKNMEEEEKIKSNRDLYDVISTCEKQINDINKYKGKFDRVEVNNEVDMLSENTIKIKEYLKLKPESLKYVDRFVNYYLPTTTKLLASYDELDNNGVETQADKESKENIHSAFIALNSAYKNLFEQITSINNMDINADISVLNTMLTQDGLKTNKEFEKVIK